MKSRTISLLLLLTWLGFTNALADPPLGIDASGQHYIRNEVIFALTPDFAANLSPTGKSKRAVNQTTLQKLHPQIAAIKGGHTCAENWLAGRNLPARIKATTPQVPAIARILLAELHPNVDAADVLADLKQNPAIEWAALNLLYSVNQVPNDSGYSNQWAPPLIRAEEAWDVTPADTTIDIAIVDSGVDLHHTDLEAIISYDRGFGLNTDGDAPGDGRNGFDHGTHVAGIAAAIRNNSTGVAGIAQARIMAMGCSFWNSDASEYGIAYGSLAILDAVANDAEIINCSFAQPDTMTPDMLAALDIAEHQGVVVVVAAGNDAHNVTGIQWAQHGLPIIVSNTRSNDTLAPSSNYGYSIYMAAPGEHIFSTVPGETGYKSGTSMASPQVAGAAALLLSMNRTLLGVNSIKHLLRRMAVDISLPGKDVVSGWGRLSLPVSFVRPLRNAAAFVGSASGDSNGTYAQPYGNIQQALGYTAPGGVLILNGGLSDQAEYSYPPVTITNSVTLTVFPDKPVTIGQ